MSGRGAEVEQVEVYGDPGLPRRTGNCDYVDKIGATDHPTWTKSKAGRGASRVR